MLIDFLTRFLMYMKTEEFKNTNFKDYEKKGLDNWYKDLSI